MEELAGVAVPLGESGRGLTSGVVAAFVGFQVKITEKLQSAHATRWKVGPPIRRMQAGFQAGCQSFPHNAALGGNFRCN